MPRTLKSILKAQGRLRKLTPTAIIDIGSNSVRLVVYEGLSRSPTPLFNEKILCGLGANIGETGRLDDTAVERALKALRRFKVLSAQSGADDIYTLATAAARDAANGPDFIKKAQNILDCKIHILTGEEEASYSAMGVQCGFFEPRGVTGDMGGGSVEFQTIDQSPKGSGITLPLGGLRLRDETGENVSAARKLAKSMIKGNEILSKAEGGVFYAIGGTWRALGRLHMARMNYPLHVMHNYEITAEEAIKLCKRLTGRNGAAMRGIEAVSSSRRHLLPFGAALLLEIMAVMKPEKIVFSALGVREGYLFSLLPEKVQKADPLVVASEEFAVLRARSPAHGRELSRWSGAAFKVFGMKENAQEKRYRKASCLLADIMWRSHPDYRGAQSLNIISNADFVGVDHAGRAYLALATYYRHEGLLDDAMSPAIIAIAPERLRERARLLGAIFRVAFQLSTAMPGILPRIKLERGDDDTFYLTAPKALADFEGERLLRRLSGLSTVADKKIVWRIAD